MMIVDRTESQRAPSEVRSAEFSVAVAVVDHGVAHLPQIWGLMEAISEV
jgi:hypothetical protein